MKQEHGPESIYWDNLGEGFRIECLCDWTTFPGRTVAEAGEDFDDHLEEVLMENS